MSSLTSTSTLRPKDPPDSTLLGFQAPKETRRLSRRRLWAYAIREGFVALLPLTLLGAMANVLAYLPIQGYNAWMSQSFGPQWADTAALSLNATMGIMGLASAMVIAMRLSALLAEHGSRSEAPQASVAAVAAAGFMLVVLPGQPKDLSVLGYVHILEGLLVGLATAELMHWASRWLPRHEGLNALESGVPLQQALRLSEQAAIVLGLVYLGHHTLSSVIGPWLLSTVLAPLHQTLQAHLPGAWLMNVLLVLINQLLWLVGINGGQLFLSMGAAGATYLADPAVLYAPHAASPTFVNAFAHLGGAGATWGLIIACLLNCKDAGLRKLAWFSALPALLNVNELLLFGIPLVFGRALLVPFVAAPALNCLIAVAAVEWGGMALSGQAVVWSTPMLISGYVLTDSWSGAAVQAVALCCSVLIYLPYVRRLEAQRQRRNQRTLSAALSFLTNPIQAPPSLLERADNLGDIARALMEDFRRDLGGPQVTLAYQPQHDATGRVVGVEALLRWRHVVHGPIPTAAIINIAEECETIHTIGHWVVNQACADLAQWRRAGWDGFVVSINMSPAQLENPDWVTVVRKALQSHNLDAPSLDLEITEGRMMSSSQQADDTLAELEALGLKLSMDDFGMGCTSLLYMQRFRMHSIKLDGRLTRDVLNNPVDQDIIRAVARLGKSQGVCVVAEFVEHQAQRDLLQDLGCDLFQGWLYSPALPAAEMPAYLARVHRPA
ncbi:EAL domain-containing protein [Ideonella paludis]|uniref:PTS sugar transporter subunit IIC/EAL domain-containing protein n=1 Tax=Ideonella paludis TaxID=1233411 RepID=A0ABS5DZI3_9BURK|nr:EAL domain-containing protein [Ideonella paludis]MBQ0936479.1 PTS sugar transporter subunit IIC/EAL domain-containing protein [Ideonella paludis]